MSLSGSSLIYTLMIGLLISALLGALILMNLLQQKHFDHLYHNQIARDNLYSGAKLILSKPIQWEEKAAFSLFNSPIDSFSASIERWGLLGLMHAKGVHGKESVQASGLFGRRLTDQQQSALFLKDASQPLRLAGNTRLKGKVYLPTAGLQAGVVDGRPFQGESLHTGEKKSSWLQKMPNSQKDLMPIWQELYRLDSLQRKDAWEQIEQIDEVFAFDSLPFRYFAAGNLIIREASISGKAVFWVSGTLQIEKTAKLNDVIFFAREIVVEAGFKGRFQGFALENIQIKPKVKLSYPSLLYLNLPDEKRANLIVESDAEIEGMVIVDNQRKKVQPHRRSGLYIGKSAKIWGAVYACQNAEIQGEVLGHVYTTNFVYTGRSRRYFNFLLDAKLDYSALNTEYVAPLFYGGKAHRIIRFYEKK